MTIEQKNSRIFMMFKQNAHRTNALSSYYSLKGRHPEQKERNV